MGGETLWYVSRSTGVMAQILLSGVMVLGILTAGRTRSIALSRAALLRLHRNLTMIAVIFTAVHVGSAIADGYVSLSVADAVVPFGSAFAPLWIGLGAIVIDLMLAITVTSILRRHLSQWAWRAIHLSAYALWPIAMLHGWGTTGGDAATGWMVGVDIACIAIVAGALTVRLLRPAAQDTVARRKADQFHDTSMTPEVLHLSGAAGKGDRP